jgi:transcriptional regulator with XRE-family HTH domain
MENTLISRNLMESFRDLLCEERKKRKLTQHELSAKSGLSRQTISLFESGKRVPTLLSLFYLSKGLSISSVKFLSLLIKKIEFYERRK